MRVPKNWPVQPVKLAPNNRDYATCGTCGRIWNDALSTSMTPAPSGRCPFEPFHKEEKLKPKKRLKKFSVLLMYPDYLASSEGYGETYFTCVEAKSVKDAEHKARRNCINENNWDSEDVESHEDFAVVLVIAGDHKDIQSGT